MNATCPLCQIRQVNPKTQLYKAPVCRKCYYKFANRRQLAYLIDIVVLQVLSTFLGGALGIGMTMIAGPEMTNEQSQAFILFSTLFGFGLSIVYGIKDGFAGKSLGKLICRITCMKETTYRPAGLWDSFVRNLLLQIPFFIFVVLLRMNKGHRPGDGFAKTRVIWDKYRDNLVFNPNAELQPASFTEFDATSTTSQPIDPSNPYAPPLAR